MILVNMNVPFLVFPNRFNMVFIYMNRWLGKRLWKIKKRLIFVRTFQYSKRNGTKNAMLSRLPYECVCGCWNFIIKRSLKTFTQWIQAILYTTKYDLAWKRKPVAHSWRWKCLMLFIFILWLNFFSFSLLFSSCVFIFNVFIRRTCTMKTHLKNERSLIYTSR